MQLSIYVDDTGSAQQLLAKNKIVFNERPKNPPSIVQLVTYLIETEILQLSTHQSGKDSSE